MAQHFRCCSLRFCFSLKCPSYTTIFTGSLSNQKWREVHLTILNVPEREASKVCYSRVGSPMLMSSPRHNKSCRRSLHDPEGPQTHLRASARHTQHLLPLPWLPPGLPSTPPDSYLDTNRPLNITQQRAFRRNN